jgi:hypothetical protein
MKLPGRHKFMAVFGNAFNPAGRPARDGEIRDRPAAGLERRFERGGARMQERSEVPVNRCPAFGSHADPIRMMFLLRPTSE